MAISENLRRLLRYRMCVEKFKDFGLEKIFSYMIGKETGVSAEQVRKDFSKFEIKGNKKGGYNINDLLGKINNIFKKDETQNIVIVGVGNIGKALIQYKGFDKYNIKIIAAFDIDPVLLKKEFNVPVYPMDMLSEIIQKFKVKIAVIAVPEPAAQEVCYSLLGSGITGIMNFSPAILKVPDTINIYNVDLMSVLEALLYHSRA